MVQKEMVSLYGMLNISGFEAMFSLKLKIHLICHGIQRKMAWSTLN